MVINAGISWRCFVEFQGVGIWLGGRNLVNTRVGIWSLRGRNLVKGGRNLVILHLRYMICEFTISRKNDLHDSDAEDGVTIGVVDGWSE